jgi:hypothetical protein
MELRELLLVVARFAHSAAAAVLIGSSAYQLLLPSASLGGAQLSRPMSAPERSTWKDLLELTLLVFLLTGALLTFERLSAGAASTAYVLLLGLKLVLSALVYRWAFQLRRAGAWEAGPIRKLVGAGLLVLFLAAILKTIYEGGLRV